MDPNDISLLLERDILNYVIITGIFFVAGTTLFNFTSSGRIFSIVSFLIAFLLLITIITYYFTERKKIKEKGGKPRIVTDIFVSIFIAVAVLIFMVLLQIWLGKSLKLLQ